jgi:PAS domain-containing protein
MTCAEDIVSNTAVPLQRYLDKLPEPVLAVDSDGVVSFLNRKAQDLVGKTQEQAAQRRGGDVFECIHAAMPEGCGRTIHCSGCVVRNSVATTYRTGEPQLLVPATLKKGDPDDPTAVVLTITTVKSGDLVLLRINKVDSTLQD